MYQLSPEPKTTSTASSPSLWQPTPAGKSTSPVSSPGPALQLTAGPGGKHKPTPQEAARLANVVYGGEGAGALPPGWQVSALVVPGVLLAYAGLPKDASRELKRAHRHAPNAPKGFASALYERGNPDGTLTYAYVTAGTDDLHDGLEDARQPLGLKSAQYLQSVKNAGLLHDALANHELYFIGHSLGGGLASANALATGREAITFNAAGLSRGTRRRGKLMDPALYQARGGHIDAYVVEGEVVSRAQSVSVQLLLLSVLRPVLGRELPRLRRSADRHGLRAEGELHALPIARPLSGTNAAGEKNRFYRLPPLSAEQRVELLAQQRRLSQLLATVPQAAAVLDVVNFWLGLKQSATNHTMAVVEALIQQHYPSLADH